MYCKLHNYKLNMTYIFTCCMFVIYLCVKEILVNNWIIFIQWYQKTCLNPCRESYSEVCTNSFISILAHLLFWSDQPFILKIKNNLYYFLLAIHTIYLMAYYSKFMEENSHWSPKKKMSDQYLWIELDFCVFVPGDHRFFFLFYLMKYNQQDVDRNTNSIRSQRKLKQTCEQTWILCRWAVNFLSHSLSVLLSHVSWLWNFPPVEMMEVWLCHLIWHFDRCHQLSFWLLYLQPQLGNCSGPQYVSFCSSFLAAHCGNLFFLLNISCWFCTFFCCSQTFLKW